VIPVLFVVDQSLNIFGKEMDGGNIPPYGLKGHLDSVQKKTAKKIMEKVFVIRIGG
jgi:hypothetical protein